MQQTKQCAGCGETKSVSEFHKQQQSPDGYRPRCKVCRKAETEAWYVANREAVKARSKAWRETHREQYAKMMREWRAKNKDYKRRLDRSWRDRNREHVRQRERLYQQAHPEHAKNQKARRRIQQGAEIHPITAAEWQMLKDRYEGCCAYCGVEEPRPTMDHVVPLKKGGGHTVDNIVPACGPCNRAKSTMSVMEFLASRQGA